jgi:dipeptidyl aminopeptidase/acylaminoacyl peptidase
MICLSLSSQSNMPAQAQPQVAMRPSIRKSPWTLGFLCALCVKSFLFLLTLSCLSLSAPAQELDKPLQNIDEEITAFSFAPDGRILYSVRRNFKTKLYDLQHDDIWIQESNGKRRRLLQGDKFNRGTTPFSYTVDSFRWSPSGHIILAQFFATTVVDPSGKTQDSSMTLVMEENGKEIRPGGTDSLIPDAANASFLADNVTIIYYTETVRPHALFSFQYTNIATGPAGKAFEGRTFMDADYLPRTNTAIAIERDRAQTGPPRIQRLDLLAQDDRELATLEDFAGNLVVSPSGKKAAYFVDKEVLEIRDLTAPDRVARVRVGFGVFRWSPDENSILLKRAPDKKSGEIGWIDLPPLAATPVGHETPIAEPAFRPILHGVTVREFSISPDGRLLGVIAPGKRNLLIFPLPR